MTVGTASAVSNVTTPQASLNMQDLLKVLLTQLSYQDPLKPVDNEQFMAQIAQFTSLEQTEEMNSKLSDLLITQASLQSVGLIGRTVDLTMGSSGSVTGTVTALSLTGVAPQLTVTTSAGQVVTSVDLSRITAVR